FQAIDGIRGFHVTGVQTCALPISVLYDLLAIAVLQLVGTGEPGPLLLALLVLNPIDGVRALLLTLLGADVLLGPSGAAMTRLMEIGSASCRESVSTSTRVVARKRS